MAKRGRKRKKKRIINGKTFFNLIGLFLLLIAVMMLASFSQMFTRNISNDQVLKQINLQLFSMYGGLAIFVPFILMLIAGHFFNSKKLKFIKLHITFGSIILFVSLIGLFRSGSWGSAIYDNFSLDFTALGAVAILIVGFLVGLILFLDTTIDVLFLSVLNILKPFSKLFSRAPKLKKKTVLEEKAPQKKEGSPDNFIRDRTVDNKPVAVNPQTIKSIPSSSSPNELSIKPSVQSDESTWVYPPITLLRDVKQKEADRGDVKANAQVIESTLDSFGIRARVAEVNFGPTVTQYAIEITRGTKLSKITALSNDLALALAAPNGLVRIEAPIPGRSLVGIEIPNKKPEIVTLKNLIESKVLDGDDPLLVPLGLDVGGAPRASSIAQMPHILIAGTTGSGKSVMLNSWITTLMIRTRPDQLRMILVDPKQVEMVQYNGAPHLLTDVITQPSKVVSALQWSVAEMESRYKALAKAGVRNLAGYNKIEGIEKKPYIVFIIDELADLMVYAANDVEDLITRIAQKARAVGIHLVLTTQRPSVDVITGLMKANIPGRIAFNVSSMVDSRVIIDMPGAEKLLGRGDMFYLPPDQAKPRRIQGPFITEAEVHDIVGFLKSQAPEVHYTEEITEHPVQMSGMVGVMGQGTGADANRDPLFQQSIEVIMQSDKASASLLQRKLRIGYARAARILDELFEAGYVGPHQGSKPRDVLRRSQDDSQVQQG